jgi:hypothetical protein
MANPKEKIFLLYQGMEASPTCTSLMKYIEEDMGKRYKDNPKRYLHWYRLRGGRVYIMGTIEDTLWTAAGIISNIQKNVPDSHTVFCVEIQNCQCQGLMDRDFWKFMNTIQDLTGHITINKRFTKLKKIKELLDKKEELKRKEAELENREAEIVRKKELLSEEEELLKKEEDIRKREAELNKKEQEIKKKKKFLGIF